MLMCVSFHLYVFLMLFSSGFLIVCLFCLSPVFALSYFITFFSFGCLLFFLMEERNGIDLSGLGVGEGLGGVGEGIW